MRDEISKSIGPQFGAISFVDEQSNESRDIPLTIPTHEREMTHQLRTQIEARVRDLKQ
jgi:hypothetical protein